MRSLLRLRDVRREREQRKQFLVEGVRGFAAAVAAGRPIAEIVASRVLLRSAVANRLVRDARQRGTRVTEVSPEQFRRLSLLRQASGIACVLPCQTATLPDIVDRDATCWLVAESIRSPGNLGTLLRTSAAVGGGGLIVVGRRVDAFDPAVVRAAMGAFFQQTIVRTDLSELGHWVRQHNRTLVAAAPDGESLFHQTGYPRGCLIAVGDERRGLQPRLSAICSKRVRIPMASTVDSLNVGVAGSLLMYEVWRSRHGATEPRRRPTT